MHKSRGILAACLLVIAGAGCAAEVESAPETAVSEQPLAVLDIDGAEVQFLEQRAGFPFVVAFTEPGQTSPLADPSLTGLNLVELYERLSGEEAPIALWQALEREHAAESELALPDPQVAEPDQVPEPAGFVEKALTDRQFIATYCHLVQVCHTDVTGTGEYNRYTRGVKGWVNPWQGSVTVQVRVKFVTGWENVGVVDVPQDIVAHYWTSYAINRAQKVKVHNADGDFYHWAHGW